MKELFHSHHPFRIFLVSALITVLALGFVGIEMGASAFFIAAVLILVEVTFSFDNAIINAKVLATMSRFWQTLFITVGIFIAVFGMRLVFPIVIVMITAGLSAGEVIDLALNQPDAYSARVNESHVAIASFGGMFLLMLCLHFFINEKKTSHWVDVVERPLQRIGKWWVYTAISLVVLVGITLVPFNDQPLEVLYPGLAGLVTYLVVHGLADLFARKQEVSAKGKAVVRTGLAGFMSFMYLEVLDASFSFDSVIGAFAITKDVILIAIGLGIGALWVRSLTIFMVRKRVLHAYRYLEHGAHYTIGFLSLVLLSSVFIHLPEAVAGITGLTVIGLSVWSSIRAARRNDAKIAH